MRELNHTFIIIKETERYKEQILVYFITQHHPYTQLNMGDII